MSRSTSVSLPALESSGTAGKSWLTLAAVCLAAFLVPSSLTTVALALPDIRTDLAAGESAAQWTINAYNIAAAGTMLAAGSLADRWGRRRMYAAGVLAFAGASLVSAAAPQVLVLDVARAVAGIGGAMVLTAGTALVSTAFHGPAADRAFGLLGVVSGIGLAAGPTAAGVLVDTLGWRWVFAAQGALALLAIAAAAVAKDSPSGRCGRTDWAGAAAFTAGLVLFGVAVVQAPDLGWSGWPTLLMFAGFLVAMLWFVRIERRRPDPICDLSLLRSGRFVGLCLAPIAVAAGFVALLILLPPYLSTAAGLTAGATGLVMLLLTGPVLVAPLAGSLLLNLGLRDPAVIGLSLFLQACGIGWLAYAGPGGGVGTLAAPLLITGTGAGLSMGLLDGAAIRSVVAARAGMAAGLFNTARLAGEALVIAVAGSLLVTLRQSGPYPAALDSLLWILFSACVAGFLAVVFLLTRTRKVV